MYSIETPPTAVKYVCVSALLSDEELVAAKEERPDLIFKELTDQDVIKEIAEPDEDITVIGNEAVKTMAMPSIRLK